MTDGGRSEPTRWLTAQQQRDWRAVILGMTYLSYALSADLERATGLAMPDYELLVRLSEAPERRMRMSDLADSVAHSRSRVTHTVTRLEREGLVRRVPAAGDRRGVLAVLTPTGLAALEAAAPRHVDSVRARLVDVLTPEQLHGLGSAMRAVLAPSGIDVPDPAVDAE